MRIALIFTLTTFVFVPPDIARDVEPVVDSGGGKTSTSTALLLIPQQMATATLSKAPITGAFDPPTVTGPDEMLFRFDVSAAVPGGQQPVKRAVIITPPTGFRVDPSRFNFDATVGLHGESILKRSNGNVTGHIVMAAIVDAGALYARGKPSSPISTTYFSFSWVPLIAIRTYFYLGVIGIVAGYLVRIAKKLLDSTRPAPHRVALAVARKMQLAAVANEPAPSMPQMLFWEYWYGVDFAVTVILGVVMLISLMQNGRPPATAGYSVNALAIGFAIGLLTNTEIITKVTPPV